MRRSRRQATAAATLVRVEQCSGYRKLYIDNACYIIADEEEVEAEAPLRLERVSRRSTDPRVIVYVLLGLLTVTVLAGILLPVGGYVTEDFAGIQILGTAKVIAALLGTILLGGGVAKGWKALKALADTLRK